MSFSSTNKSYARYIVFFSALMVSCLLAFINKFPVVYPDTGTYIDSGFRNIVPYDRPLFYGLFIRHISLSASLWLVVLMQSFICCFLIYELVGVFITSRLKPIIFLITVTVLSVFTGYSYNISFLMPDIFSAVSWLALVLLWFKPDLPKWRKLLIALFFVFGLMVHLSNLLSMMIVLGCVAMVLIYRRIKHKPVSGKIGTLLLPYFLTGAALLMVPMLHFLIGKSFTYSKGSHVFMMNHLVETGILDDYLSDACETKNYTLCQYKDSMVWDFMWDQKSPLYKTGGWSANQKEYAAILKDVYTTPKYIVSLGQKSLEYGFKQFFCFTIHSGNPFDLQSPPGGQISWHFKDYEKEFLSSRQNTNTLDLFLPQKTELILVLFSMMGLLLVLLYPFVLNQPDKRLLLIIASLFLFSLVNSFVCANLAVIDPRYQSRVVWLFPLLLMLLLLNAFGFRLKKRLFSGSNEKSYT